ncbi:hypothetical protein ABZV15_24810 [Streptomyces sp. NPDC005246]
MKREPVAVSEIRDVVLREGQGGHDVRDDLPPTHLDLVHGDPSKDA